MQAIRSKDTKAELALGKELWAKGYRYRRNDKNVFGKPDFTFKRFKIAVFVDSEYFHGKDWEHQKFRIKTNREFWWRKIEGNIQRDNEVNKNLTSNGWTVLRFWDRDILKNLVDCTSKIETHLTNIKTPIKYSDLRKTLGIEVNNKTDGRLSYLTHFFQNPKNGESHYFQLKAKEYLYEIHQKLSILEDPDFQYYLPINWDIPFPTPKNPKFKFIDLFAGIGGIRLAYQNLGGKCVFTSEWNNYSKRTYEANFGEVPFGDITKIKESEIPDHDLLVAGFPCQPFSIAGVSKKNALGRPHGFLCKTQGTLFFDIARILEHKRPAAFMLENVKNLMSHDSGKTYNVISNTLKDLGYSIHAQVLNSKHFVPQHRARIIIVGFRSDIDETSEDFAFPVLPKPGKMFKDILEPLPDPKYTLTDHLWKYLRDYSDKHKAKGNGFGFGLTDMTGIARTLSARYYKDGSEVLIPQPGQNPRRLTPRECARLQGFPDEFIIPVSDTQAYKQFGNSVTVPLIQAVGNQLISKLLRLNGKHIKENNSVGTNV